MNSQGIPINVSTPDTTLRSTSTSFFSCLGSPRDLSDESYRERAEFFQHLFDPPQPAAPKPAPPPRQLPESAWQERAEFFRHLFDHAE